MHTPSHRFHPLLLALLTASLFGCAGDERAPVAKLTGDWVGERVENGALIRWLVRHAEDGGIHIQFKTCFAGEAVSATEHFGDAVIEEGEYRTTIRRIVDEGEVLDLAEDDVLQYNYDVLELTDDRMVYRYIGTPPIVYTVQRVDEDPDMSCPPATHQVDTSSRGRRGTDGWIRRGTESEAEFDMDGDAEAGAQDPGDGADGARPGAASDTD